MERFEKVYQEYSVVEKKLFRTSKNYIKRALKTAKDKTIVLNPEYPVSVCYDGGTHPEYDSNVFSIVNYVFEENGTIYIDTEDNAHHHLSWLTGIEAFNVADAVRYAIKNGSGYLEDEDY